MPHERFNLEKSKLGLDVQEFSRLTVIHDCLRLLERYARYWQIMTARLNRLLQKCLENTVSIGLQAIREWLATNFLWARPFTGLITCALRTNYARCQSLRLLVAVC